MTTQFDFSSIADLGKYWDGSKKVGKPGTTQGKKTYTKWKSDREAAKKKNALRPGEVKKLVNGKWVSNKD